MVLITHSGPQTLPIGLPAPDFKLRGTDEKTYTLASFAAGRILVVNFTCNHCPYAQAYEDRFIALAAEFTPQGAAFLAVSPNDAKTYPADSFENMQRRAAEKNLPFPYLYDEKQAMARAYGAVCTPHLFLFDAGRKLAYEGRIDDNWKNPDAVKSRDLRDAIEAVLAGRPAPAPQTNPMGCSIKWK